jgi:lactobin A/cerein 7B family class IIb bacteriocin
MQNMEHTNSEILELTDAELEAINGGNWLGDAFRAIGGAIVTAGEFIIHGFQGPGDLRRPL